ncbi:MAG TPA: TPM domain-containing protein [Burkholderiaceae bacterium]|nr:TPM domain-containing protein [Burkholderiaceae bacterium]
MVRRWLVGALVALAPLLVLAQAPGRAEPPAAAVGPDGLLLIPPLARVVDLSGVLAPADRAALEARLARFEADHGAQVAILIVPTTGVEPIEDFANRVGSTWKIGRRGIGDGLLLVVATHDRHARIEVARSLEGAIPDVVAKHVIQQKMGPHFAALDYAGGLNAALDDLLPRIEQERLGVLPNERPQRAPSHLPLLLPFLVAGVLAGLALRRALGAGGALVAGAGAGTLASFVLASVALGVLIGVVVFVFALVLGAAGRYGHTIGGPGLPPWGGGWGGESGGGSGGGGGFSSGGGGDFSGGGASGDW